MKKSKRQYRSTQGRTPKQYEDSMRVVGFAMLILAGGAFVAAIVELIETIF